MKLSFNTDRILISVILLLLFSVVFTVFVSISQSGKVSETGKMVAHTQEVLIHTQRLLSSALDNETSARGFLLTGNNDFLELLKKSENGIHAEFNLLKKLNNDNPQQQTNLDSIEIYLNKRIAFSKQLTELRIAHGAEPAMALIEKGEGKSYTEKIREYDVKIQNIENILLSERRQDNDNKFEELQKLLLLVIVCVVILLCVLLQKIRLDLIARKKAAMELLKANTELEQHVKKKTTELVQTKSTLEDTLERITDAFIALDKNWICTYVNKHTGTLTQRSPEALIGKNIWGVLPEAVGSATYKIFCEVMKEREYKWNIDHFEALDRWHENHVYPSDDGIFIFIRDITERKRAQEILKNSEEKYRILFLQSSIPKWVYDLESYKILDVNNAAVEHYGYCREEFLEMTEKDIRPYEAIPVFTEAIRKFKSKETGKFFGVFTHQKKDKTKIEVEASGNLFIYEKKECMMVECVDITEESLALAQVKQSNKRYEYVTKATSEAIWDWDLIGNAIYWGEGFQTIFGHELTEIKTDHYFWINHIHPEDKKRVRKSIYDCIEQQGITWAEEYRFLRGDGQFAYVYDKGIVIRNENQKPVRMIGAMQDVTQQKEHVNEIIRIKQNLDSLINTTKDRIWSIDSNLKIITANKAYSDAIEMFTGTPTKEGDPVIIPVFGEAILSSWTERYNRVLAGETFSVEEAFIHPFFNDVWYSVISFLPIANTNGKVTGAACYSKDITEIKRSASLVQEMNLRLHKKTDELTISNNELEQFAYVASHDLQEPLRMVTSFLTQLEKKYGDTLDSKAKSYINFAVDGAKRMRQIIFDLLEFSRVGKTESVIEKIDLNDLIKEIRILLRKRIDEKYATINTGELPVVFGYKVPMLQVFQNLIGNALKYSKKDIPAEIYITAEEYNDHWQFAVTDNGIGINKEYFDKIFIIFQRLHSKEEYSGTGMGLAITKKIVENQGGKIWVKSEEDKGSSFYFTIAKMEA